MFVQVMEENLQIVWLSWMVMIHLHMKNIVNKLRLTPTTTATTKVKLEMIS